MAVYKVIQDIEAEDKLLGPLTLKGFIYALITVFLGFIDFKFLTSTGIGPVRWVFLLIFFPPTLLFGVLASPLGKEQPTEVWLLARIRFLFKPRKRIWNQSGIKELVTITAPKVVEKHLTKELSQNEVHSRLDVLARTLDSQGWAVKNATINDAYGYQGTENSSDRLVTPSGLTTDNLLLDVHPADDILDEQNNPTAQNFANLVQQAEVKRKQGIMARIMNVSSTNEGQESQQYVAPASNARPKTRIEMQLEDDSRVDPQLQERLKEAERAFAKSHQATQPEKEPVPASVAVPQTPPVTAASQTAKLELAQSGSAFSVATLAQLANRQPTEVVINLH